MKLPSLEQNTINEKYISMIDEVLYNIKMYYSQHEDLTRRLQGRSVTSCFYTQIHVVNLFLRKITIIQHPLIIILWYVRCAPLILV